jgi:hypothetical protein
MTRSTFALIAVLLAGSASAQIIDASDYAVGTNISNAIPGVTLSFITLSTEDVRPLVGESLSDIAYTSVPLTIQSGFPAIEPNSPYQPNTLGAWTGGGNYQRLIMVQFAQPISAFSVFSLNDSGDPNNNYLFNSSGIDIASPGSSPNGCVAIFPMQCDFYKTGGSYQSSIPISTMMVGSFSAASYVLSIDATPAPEIDSSSAVSALTLLLGSFMVLRSRRPKFVTEGPLTSHI